MTAKLSVRVPLELHTEFKIAAARERQSMEALIREWIEDFVSEHDEVVEIPGQTKIPGSTLLVNAPKGEWERVDPEDTTSDWKKVAPTKQFRPDPKVKK